MPLLRCVSTNVVRQLSRRYFSVSTKSQDPFNAFICRNPDLPGHASSAQPTGSLHGRAIAVKDNICTIDLPTTCASRSLEGFQSPYDATVVERLRRAGAHIVGKTNMDEFGMGSHSKHSHWGPVTQWAKVAAESTEIGLAVGGSSGGSAVAIQQGYCWGALGTDTGGSVRLPAAWCGVTGFKPSYGMISRWGVVDYANSFDTVGFLGRDVDTCRKLFEATASHDAKDPTSLTQEMISRTLEAKARNSHSRHIRIGVPIEYNIVEMSELVREAWLDALELCKSSGFEVVPVSLPLTQSALSAYYVLAPAEASSNLAKYDGVRYGTRAEGKDGANGILFSNTRAQGFGDEVKRRILLGSYTLSADAIDNYFIQAQKVRRLVQQEFNSVFAQAHPLVDAPPITRADSAVDFLLCPTAPTPPPRLEDIKKQSPVESYINDVFTVPASLAGLPAISVPWKDKTSATSAGDPSMNVGIQIIGQFGYDRNVLAMAEALERMIPSTIGNEQSGSALKRTSHQSEGDQSVMGFPYGLAAAYMNAKANYGPNVAAVRSTRHDLAKNDLAGEKDDGQTWRDRNY